MKGTKGLTGWRKKLSDYDEVLRVFYDEDTIFDNIFDNRSGDSLLFVTYREGEE